MDRSRLLDDARLPAGVDINLDTLGAIADEHAVEVWGEPIARGEPFPVVDAAGIVNAYVFPYARGGQAFPPDDALADCGADDAARFGAVYVAARPTAHPVLRVVHALHPVFRRARDAETIGRSTLEASEASVSRIYWLGLHEEYLEVEGGGRTALLDIQSLRPVERETVLRTEAGAGAEPPAVEALLLQPVPHVPTGFQPGGLSLGPALKLVPMSECVPVVDWTYWCVPTAWTMAVCYYDNYVKNSGGILGYGRLVGYWLDHVASGNNIPDYINQAIDPNSGPPPTWRAGFADFSDFIQQTYGYAFATRDVEANAANDWAWTDITTEIDAGRPFVWGVPNHATCALGYRVASDGSRRVVINTTWGDTMQQQREEWLHTKGTGLTAIIPGGGAAGQHLVLWTPDGGESLLTNVATTIGWHVWGDQITTAEVSASADGGNTWTVVRQAAPCGPGWNTCDWTPLHATQRARVRIRGLDAAGRYVAGDGSQTNVTVLPGPRSVRLETILVSSRTDGSGAFSAPHGLERYTPDGYAIRAIVVSAQHKNGNWHTLEFSNSVDNRFWWNQSVVAGVIGSPDFFERPVQVIVFAEAVVG